MSLTVPRPSVTAPVFADNPARWAVWYLTTNPRLYEEFERRVMDMVEARPGVALSADQVLHVMRWNSLLRAEGDIVAINNNLSSLFARLFVLEHPAQEQVFSRRRSVWDDLPVGEWGEVRAAFDALRARRLIK